MQFDTLLELDYQQRMSIYHLNSIHTDSLNGRVKELIILSKHQTL